ncbi:MAG: hypothetical protein ABIF71_01985, partial [Planctomycetota bacterium]
HHSAPHAKWIGCLFTGTNHPNRPMVDSRAWLTPKSAKAFSAGIRKSAFAIDRSVWIDHLELGTCDVELVDGRQSARVTTNTSDAFYTQFAS